METDHYEKPSSITATENTYDVPQHPKSANSSDADVVKYSCNWKLSALLVCFGVFAVVASVSLALTVWSVVRDRGSFQHTEVTPLVPEAINSQLTVLQDFQNEHQNQLFDFQDQLSSFMKNLSALSTVLQDIQNEHQNQLFDFQDQLSSFMANLSALSTALQDSQTEQENQLHNLNSFMVNLSLFSQLTTSQKEAIRQSVLGLTKDDPVSSCRAVPRHRESGDYWIRHANGSAVRVYCDMTRSCGGVTGGWTRVTYLEFENGSDPCPHGFRERSDSDICTCGIDSTTAACPSILVDTYGISYSRVCGKVLGYQYHTTDAFGDYGRGENPTIDSNYVDGVSLTHGDPRQHIWTFAAAIDEVGHYSNGMAVCPCSNSQLNRTSMPPQFVGQHYFCDSGVRKFRPGVTFYSNDPLWDGAGCGSNSTCCTFNNPPWFQRELPSPTTDDIEMRVCTDEGNVSEDIRIAHVVIYVQ